MSVLASASRVSLAVLLLALISLVAAQEADIPDSALLLKVTVVDSRNHPVRGADIAVESEAVGRTDESGMFYLPRKLMDTGNHSLSVSHAGFRSRKLTIAIPGDPAQLPVLVRVQLETFVPLPPSNIGQPAPNYRVYELFYATDRKSTRSKDPEEYYAGEAAQDGKLELGICSISVPATHQKGVLESPSLFRLEFQYDPDKHIMMRIPQPLASDRFFEKLSARVGQSKRKEAFVFIHGYNTTFASAARKAVQVAADLNFDGAPILYSWPSMGMFRGYFTDEKNVAWSVPHLEAFLEQVALQAKATRVHLIAHSMGNRAMTEALRRISQRPAGGPRFQQIVLAAPDIRVDQIQELERAMLPLAHRVTLYTSRNDDALILARILDGIARAGERIQNVMVPGIDAVDASAVRTDFIGHGYFAASTSVIADIKQLLTDDAAPQSRRLVPARLADLMYWVIPAADVVK